MRAARRLAAAAAACAALGLAARAEGTAGGLPLPAARRLSFEASTATWTSLDVSPDGRRIVLDVLGRLYTMDAVGGEATPLGADRGLAFDSQPTFSPDGRRIAFVSDASGSENLWIVGSDGAGARQITFADDDAVLTSPAWSADGASLFAARFRADLNGYELWRYGLDGRATLVTPVHERPDAPRGAWRSSLGPAVSPDGRSLYVARHVGPLDFEEAGRWTIVRHDLASGAETPVVARVEGPRSDAAPGAFFRPALSHDGKRLAYEARTAGRTELRLLDLGTGQDRRLAFPVDHDQLQASAWQDVAPRYAFTPDDRAILLPLNGGVARIDLAGGPPRPIAFRVHVERAVAASTREHVREPEGPVLARLIMAPEVSPDGRRVAFSALGRVWLQSLGDASPPQPIDGPDAPAFQPSWSPDSRDIVFVTWDESAGGAVWRAAADGGRPPQRVSEAAAYYSHPVFSPDGQEILAVRSPRQARLDLYMEYGALREAELVRMPAIGGPARVLTTGRIGGRPQFGPRADQVFILAEDGLDAVELSTGARTLRARVLGPGWYFQDGPQTVDDLRISPDGRWLLAQVAQQAHLLAAPPPGGVVDLTSPGRPHRRLGGADYLGWSADGREIVWSTGPSLHLAPRAAFVLNPADHADWSEAPRPAAQADRRIVLEAPRAGGHGALVLRGAHLITMDPQRPYIPDGDILIVDDRIAGVGPRGSLRLPAGAAVRDVSGRWITPGFIDVHDHIATVRRDVLDLADWGLAARLAFGVTTSFDPSTLTVDMLAYQDLLDAGLMTGPRLRQTGVALFSMQRFASLDEVREVLRRYRDDYGLSNIKEYRTGDRRVREWVSQACRELGLQPTTEGALAMKLDLSQIIDGYAGNEHALVAAPLGEDVLGLLTAMRTSYVTTLQITNGGPSGEDFSIDADDPASDPRVQRFWPPLAIEQALTHRSWRRLSEYRFPAFAADAARLQRAGGLVGMGSHGETPGIGFHMEMEEHQMGGMSPGEVLHAATIGSAETIGRERDLGSLEAGKLADLVVLDADPRLDIRNARLVQEVMVGGRLRDAATLTPIWPRAGPPPARWWADGAAPGRDGADVAR